MFFVPFVFIGEDFFEPVSLLFCNLHIYRLGTVAYEELLATLVAPEGPHFL